MSYWSSKAGYVYFFRHISGLVKIGYTANLKARIKQLTYTEGNGHLVGSIFTVNASNMERTMHKFFAAYRVKGEWFNLSNSQIIEVVD